MKLPVIISQALCFSCIIAGCKIIASIFFKRRVMQQEQAQEQRQGEQS